MNVITGRRIGELDWGGLINNVVSTAGSTVQSFNAVKAQQIQANTSAQLAQYNLAALQSNQQYQTQAQIIPGVPNIALLGGAALVAFMLLRKK